MFLSAKAFSKSVFLFQSFLLIFIFLVSCFKKEMYKIMHEPISDEELEKLALEAERILDSEKYMGEGIEEFQQRGGSPGGARPKIFTQYEGKEWLVKFRAKQDSISIGRDEYKYSMLAKECGIEMPETQLFENKYFGVERFDRTKDGKLHVVSIAGLIGADYRVPSIDYTHIFQVCATLTHSVAEL